jgi:hypothetical protein
VENPMGRPSVCNLNHGNGRSKRGFLGVNSTG